MTSSTLMSKSESTPKLVRMPTWPALNMLTPTMISKGKPQSTIQQPHGDIDEDPFSHFLSPILDDEDPFDDDEFSAGISSAEDEPEPERNTFRTRIGERWDSLVSHPKLQRQRPRTPPNEDQLPELMNDDVEFMTSPQGSPPNLTSMEEELDGWEADRARQRRTFGYPLQRPKLKTSRTLSGRKHSWTEPSANLWTVDEEAETEIARPSDRGRVRLRHT